MKMPRSLSLAEEEREVWADVVNYLGDNLQDSDVFIVEVFCRHYCRWQRLAIEESRLGDAAFDAETRRRASTLTGAWKMLEGAMTKLGLSPADRKKIAGRGPNQTLATNPLIKMLDNRTGT